MNLKKGNIVLALFPLFTILLICVLFIVAIIYSQVIIGIVNIKSDLFYIVQNSIMKINKEALSYGQYIINEVELKDEIENLIIKNYMTDKNGMLANRSVGVLKVSVDEVNYYTSESQILNHTAGTKKEPFVHIVLTVKTRLAINLGIKDTYDTKIHEDIKLTRLKMF